VNPGDLGCRIRLQAYATTKIDGFPVQEWTTFATVWAQKIPVSQREYFAAAAVQQENVVRWKIRWRKPYIDGTGKLFDWQECRVKDLSTGISYDITGADDGGGKVELILICKEVSP